VRSFTKNFFKVLGWALGILIVFVAVMRIFFVDVAVVGHNAMAPTTVAGDQVLVWRHANLDMGDVTICQHPSNPNELVMGRVAAKGGMTIQTDRRGQLDVEGTVPDIDWQDDVQFTDTLQGRTATMRTGIEKFGNVEHLIFVNTDRQFRVRARTVPEGKLYLLSDNRTHPGQDSRYFGSVDPDTCQGTVFMRLAPASDAPNDLGHGYLDLID